MATLVNSPPPPPPKSPPGSDGPRPSGLNSVEAFCSKAADEVVFFDATVDLALDLAADHHPSNLYASCVAS